MNRKQFILLLVLVGVIGGAGWLVHQRGRDAWQSASQTIGQKLLPDLPVNDITRVVIQSGTNELNLARQDNLWRVAERGGYPANFSQLSDLLVKLADLKIIQSDEAGPSLLGRYDLLPPGAGTNTATLVQFEGAEGKTLAALWVGKKHLKKSPGMDEGGEGFPDGRYAMMPEGHMVDLVSDPLDNIEAKPENWLDKTFFSIEKPRRIAVHYPAATNSWELVRASETNDWQLAEIRPGETLDSSKISGITSPFSSASFNDVSPADTHPGAAGFDQPVLLTVDTFDHFTYAAKIGSKQGGNYPLTISVTADLPAHRTPGKDEKPEEKAGLDKAFADEQKQLADKLAKEKQFEHWIYEVPDYTVDPLLQVRAQLLMATNVVSTNAAAAN